MKSKYKVLVGSILGALAIHVAGACAGGSAARSSDGGLLDALMGTLESSTREAQAGSDAGGACCAAPQYLTAPCTTVYTAGGSPSNWAVQAITDSTGKPP